MDNREAVNWLINISADIGKEEHSDLWHYEQALTEIKDMLESAQSVATDTNVGDTISRQAAIDAIHNLYAIHGSEGSWIDQKDAFNAVNNLPSAQPERKTGSWIPYDTIPRYVVCRCSACGTDILVPCINDKTIFNYCPNCGAKMEEKQYE